MKNNYRATLSRSDNNRSSYLASVHSVTFTQSPPLPDNQWAVVWGSAVGRLPISTLFYSVSTKETPELEHKMQSKAATSVAISAIPQISGCWLFCLSCSRRSWAADHLRPGTRRKPRPPELLSGSLGFVWRWAALCGKKYSEVKKAGTRRRCWSLCVWARERICPYSCYITTTFISTLKSLNATQSYTAIISHSSMPNRYDTNYLKLESRCVTLVHLTKKVWKL